MTKRVCISMPDHLWLYLQEHREIRVSGLLQKAVRTMIEKERIEEKEK